MLLLRTRTRKSAWTAMTRKRRPKEALIAKQTELSRETSLDAPRCSSRQQRNEIIHTSIHKKLLYKLECALHGILKVISNILYGKKSSSSVFSLVTTKITLTFQLMIFQTLLT